MGYYQYLEECSIFIPSVRRRELYQSLTGLVCPDDLSDEHLIGAFSEISSWIPEFNDNGDIVYLRFVGEKASLEDEVVLKAIKPHVRDLSYIGMRGEDGDMWRWYFVGGKCYELHATIVWDFSNMKLWLDTWG